MMGNIVEA